MLAAKISMANSKTTVNKTEIPTEARIETDLIKTETETQILIATATV
jgi:hypothetical protein